MSDADARDVIARSLYDYRPTVTGMMSGIVRDLSWHELVALGDFPEIITQNRLQADAILEALADAGYAVVRKSQILVDAFGQPESIEEVRPGVTMYTWPAEDDE